MGRSSTRWATFSGARIDHALSDRGLTRLNALIAHQNEASKRVAHKLGMSFERAAEFRGRVVELYALEA